VLSLPLTCPTAQKRNIPIKEEWNKKRKRIVKDLSPSSQKKKKKKKKKIGAPG